ncbi:MAG: DUF4012 domain-containing protein [Acidimicrobiales bacterium]
MGKTEGRRRRRRKRRWIIGGTIVLLVVVWLAILSAKAVSAYHHDQQGLAALQQVRSELGPDDLTSTVSVDRLNGARAQFDAASSDLSSPLFGPITIVPVVGRQLRSAQSLSSAAGTVSGVGSSFIAQVHGVLHQRHGAGPDRVTSLRGLSAASLSAERQLAHVDTGPSQALVAPLSSKHDEFIGQLDEARSRLSTAAGVSAAVATILQGPQSYVVLASNNAEMRAGSGAFLDVGSATTSDGSVHLGSFEPSGEHTLPAGAVDVTGDFERNWGWLNPSLDLRNLGLTPQFDVTAPVAARMWTALTGQPVNGVIAIDVAGLQKLLEATGPVVADGQTVSADNVEQFLLHDQYAGLTDNAADANDRQDALGALARAVLDQLQGQTIDITSLAKAMSGAVAGRHLMLWSSNPTDQAAWVASGASGSLTARSVSVSLINLGGNKLDQFVPVQVAVTTARSGPDTAVSMTARVVNNTPPGESQFIAGPFPGVPVGYGGYRGLMAVNLPAAASHITMTGTGPLAIKGAEGPTWLVAAPITVSQGATSTANIHFVMPGGHGSMTIVPSARIPPEQWMIHGSAVPDTAATTVRW